MFANVAVAAQDLLREYRRLESLVSEVALDHWRQQAEQVLGHLTLGFVGRAADEIDLQRAPQDQRTPCFIPGPGFHEHAAYVRMDDDRVGLGLGVARLRV